MDTLGLVGGGGKGDLGKGWADEVEGADSSFTGSCKSKKIRRLGLNSHTFGYIDGWIRKEGGSDYIPQPCT